MARVHRRGYHVGPGARRLHCGTAAQALRGGGPWGSGGASQAGQSEAAEAGRCGGDEAGCAGLLGTAGGPCAPDAAAPRRQARGVGTRGQYSQRDSSEGAENRFEAVAQAILVHSANGQRGSCLRNGGRAGSMSPGVRRRHGAGYAWTRRQSSRRRKGGPRARSGPIGPPWSTTNARATASPTCSCCLFRCSAGDGWT